MPGSQPPGHGGKQVESTKDSIIYQALTLFSDRGYEGVSMRDIAAAVGIQAASLYNHFKSKEAIFSRIIEEMSARYEATVMSMQIPHGDMDLVVATYMKVNEDTLRAMASNLFLYFLKDDFAAKFRRMLTIEQFRSTQAGDVFQNFFVDSALDFQSTLFASMIERGAFIKADPYVMALHFYAPIFILLNKYDRLAEREGEALEYIARHVHQFSEIYARPAGH